MPIYGPDVTLENPAYVDPTAQIFGKVTVREGASFWPNTVARAENFEIVVGAWSNIQDFAMLHVGAASGTYIGAHCTITHHCTIHGATIGDNCLIGINATLMDGVVVGDNCTVAGGAFLTEGTTIPPNSVVMGIPGKVARTHNGFVKNRINAWYYVENARSYASGNFRNWNSEEFRRALTLERERLEREFDRCYPS
ncbi:MAG: gamma carbonic anhydrase family protein [Alphaproteobacteria bacterium]|nr:gamma carbonic anhydrase family protein [Alphaproteobacteria bacterium]